MAYQWAQVVEKAFSSGGYSIADDIAAFTEWKGRKPKSGFETGFGMFYHAALLPGVLSPKTEDLFLDYYLPKPDGMYYIYDKPLNQLPETFASRKSSCYIAYRCNRSIVSLRSGKRKTGFRYGLDQCQP